MARRVVQECDLTKQEYDPAETVTLIIKKNGKKTGRTYELSPEAAAKLEKQLVSGIQLSPHWDFAGIHKAQDNEGKRIKTLGDLEGDDNKEDDAQFIANKKRAMTEEGIDLQPREKTEDDVTVLPGIAADNSDCLHMNKGPIQTTLRNGERHFYRTCRQCRGRIPEKQKDERTSFLSGKAPPGSRVDHNPNVREREE